MIFPEPGAVASGSFLGFGNAGGVSDIWRNGDCKSIAVAHHTFVQQDAVSQPRIRKLPAVTIPLLYIPFKEDSAPLFPDQVLEVLLCPLSPRTLSYLRRVNADQPDQFPLVGMAVFSCSDQGISINDRHFHWVCRVNLP